MAIGANSYGSVAEVEALTGRYTNSGSYDGTTRPTLTQVETFIDRVSGMANAMLAQYGFTVPVSQADAKLIMDEFVVEQAVQLAHAANGAGPFSPANEQLRGTSPFTIIMQEAQAFIESMATGIEFLGAARPRNLTYGLDFTSEDADGDTIEPMFDRVWDGGLDE